MSKLDEYTQKILRYYKKVKSAGKMLKDVQSAEEYKNIYQVYTKLLDKMELYNNKMIKAVHGAGNLEMKKNIKEWKRDAKIKYKKIENWEDRNKYYLDLKEKVEKKINKQQEKQKLFDEERHTFFTTNIEKQTKKVLNYFNELLDVMKMDYECLEDCHEELENVDSVSKIIKEIKDDNMDKNVFNDAFEQIQEYIYKDVISDNLKEIINKRIHFIEKFEEFRAAQSDDVESDSKLNDQLNQINEKLEKYKAELKMLI